VKLNNTTSNGSIINKTRFAAGNGRWLLRVGDTGLWRTAYSCAAAPAFENLITTANSTAWSLVTAVFDRAVGLSLSVNGTVMSTYPFVNSESLDSTDNLLLGAYNDASGVNGFTYWLGGKIAGVVVWPSALGTTARDAAETAWGNGIYRLAITH